MSNDTQVASKTQPMQIAIGDINVTRLIYKDKPVVTFDMVDKVHGRPARTAVRNFEQNREWFIEGEDFFLVKQSNHEIRELGINISPRGSYLLTETGYLMLVKSFRDDLAWQVQRELVNKYFAPVKRVETKPSFDLFRDDPERGAWLSKDAPLLPRLGSMADMLIEDGYFQLMDVPRANSAGIAIFFELSRLFVQEQLGRVCCSPNGLIFRGGHGFVDRDGFVEFSSCFHEGFWVTDSGDSRYIRREAYLLAFDRLESQMKQGVAGDSDCRDRFRRVAEKLLCLRPEWEQVVRCRYAGLSGEDICKLLGIKRYRLNELVRELKDVGLLREGAPVKKGGGELVLEGLV